MGFTCDACQGELIIFLKHYADGDVSAYRGEESTCACPVDDVEMLNIMEDAYQHEANEAAAYRAEQDAEGHPLYV